MPPSKKKSFNPKEVSLVSPPKEETTNIELPNDENNLFDVDDDVGTSTIADLAVPSEDEAEEEVKSNNVWEHAIDILFKFSPLHPNGKSLRKWVKHQNMDDMANESHNDALIRVTKGTCNNQTETRSEQDMIVPSFPYH